MSSARTIKFLTASLFLGSLFSVGSLRTYAQQSTPPSNDAATKTETPEDTRDADVLILANVTAQELKFEAVPNPNVEFPGKPERKTVWEADRQNLPKPVEPGVTYRNIGIQLRIASRFADIDRIVAEALGEIPVDDGAAKPSASSARGKLTTPSPISKAQKSNVKQDAVAGRRVRRNQPTQ